MQENERRCWNSIPSATVAILAGTLASSLLALVAAYFSFLRQKKPSEQRPCRESVLEGQPSKTGALHTIVQRDLDRQIQVVNTLDIKSTILAAVDAGALSLAISWPSGAISGAVAIAVCSLLVCALCSCFCAIYPRPLKLRLPISDLEKAEILSTLTEFSTHNGKIVRNKVLWTKAATGLSMLGFIGVGIAHVARIISAL